MKKEAEEKEAKPEEIMASVGNAAVVQGSNPATI